MAGSSPASNSAPKQASRLPADVPEQRDCEGLILLDDMVISLIANGTAARN
jgi:hypothetical protein